MKCFRYFISVNGLSVQRGTGGVRGGGGGGVNSGRGGGGGGGGAFTLEGGEGSSLNTVVSPFSTLRALKGLYWVE